MTNLENLNRHRKLRALEERRKLADANAARHGLSKAERILIAARNANARKSLDQHQLEDE